MRCCCLQRQPLAAGWRRKPIWSSSALHERRRYGHRARVDARRRLHVEGYSEAISGNPYVDEAANGASLALSILIADWFLTGLQGTRLTEREINHIQARGGVLGPAMTEERISQLLDDGLIDSNSGQC